MSQQELLKKVVQTLEEAGIEYMLTGSVVSSLQGEPRSTHDIDLVVSIPQAKGECLLKAFSQPDYYLDAQSMFEAITKRGMFNLLHVNSGDKVDFWMLKDHPFDRSRFARRYDEEFMGMRITVSAPEDTILMKLRWARMSGGSEKQFTDALRVYEVQFEKLDLAYLVEWAHRLGLKSMLQRLRKEAQPI